MRIGVTVDEVLRDTLQQLCEVYEKYEIGKSEVDIDSIVDKSKLADYFPIKEDYTDIKNFNDMLYNTYSFEIFGAAKFMENNIMEPLNEFVYDFYAEKENKFTVLSKEFNRSIPSTLYFLSKTNINIRDVQFVDSYKEIWNEYDLIITAEPMIIETVPEGKKVIKINAPYNNSIETEYEFDTIKEMFESIDLEELIQ